MPSINYHGRILQFCAGFEALHRVPPTFEDISRWIEPKTPSQRINMMDTIDDLVCAGKLRKSKRRYTCIKPQRTRIFAFNRTTGTLEPFHVDSPIRHMVPGEN